MTTGEALSAKQKRRALEDALESETFARADQLKKFLRYIVEMEIAGKGGQISEHLVGVEALGRPEGFSPTEDSAVRTRAKALREKLRDLYERELPDAPVRIELQRGSYTPRFVHGSAPHPVESAHHPVDSVHHPVADSAPPASAPPSARGVPAWAAALALIVGFALGVSALLVYRQPAGQPIRPVVAEAWGPLAHPDANTLICIGAPPFYVVHSYDQYVAPEVPVHPIPDPIKDVWSTYRPPPPGQLTMHRLDGAAQVGVIAGVAACTNVLGRFRSSYQVLPERSVPIAALPRRNVIHFGSPEYSNNMTALLERTPFTLRFDPESRSFAVVERSGPQSRQQTFLPKFSPGHGMVELYGLITVMPSANSPDGRFRTVVFSGTNSVGSQAAAEYFSSPAHLQKLRERLLEQGKTAFPPAYQVVVRCQADNYQLVSYEFETLRIFQPSSGRAESLR